MSFFGVFFRFVDETRTLDGKPYSPSSLTCLAAGIQRFGKDVMKIHEFKLLDKKSPYFCLFRDSIDRKRKYLLSQGIGHIVRHKDEITLDEERLLWDQGIFNDSTARGLLNVTYFYNMKVFGFRAVDEHEHLMQEQYAFGTKDGVEFLKYMGRASKAVTGTIESKATPKVIFQHADPTNPRCVVALFHKYLQSLPEGGRFYRKALVNKRNGEINFSKQVVGRNTLAKIIPDMMKEAGIDTSDRNITGHSGKVTCATRLYQEGFDEQAIKSRTGHRSDAVRFYKKPSLEMQSSISKCLQPPNPKATSTVTSSSIYTPKPEPIAEAKGIQNQSEEVLEINVPKCIKKIVINRDGKKMSFEL